MHAMTTPQGIPVRDPDSNESVIGTVDMFYRCGHVSLSLPAGGSILIIDPCIGQRVYDNGSESHCGACVVLMDTFLHFRRMTMTMRICDDVDDNSQKNKVHAKANLFLGLMASEARTISSLQKFGKRFVEELIDKLEEVVDSRSPDCRARLDRANDAHCPLCGNIAMFQELSAHVSAASGSDPRYKMKVIHSLYLYVLSRVFDGRVHTRAYTEGLCLVANTDERPFDWDSSSRALLPIGFNRVN